MIHVMIGKMPFLRLAFGDANMGRGARQAETGAVDRAPIRIQRHYGWAMHVLYESACPPPPVSFE